MNDNNYTGEDWVRLAKEMTPRMIRNSVKRAYRAVGKKAREIAVSSLNSSGLSVLGNASDWKKGVRLHIYSKGGGFLVSVRGKAANKSGKGERSMHKNRFYGKTKRALPILQWAEEGTRERKTKTKGRQRKAHSTGHMRKYGFLESASGRMYTAVENGLQGEVEQAVYKVAAKNGFR